MIPERHIFVPHSHFVPSERSPLRRSFSPSLSHLALLFLVTFVYYVSGRFGLGLANVNPHATVLWAPTGISIAALLLLGYRAWPAVLVGAFLVNDHVNASFVASAGIAVGNTLEALAGAYLVNQFANGTKAFYRTKDVFRFVCLAGFLASAISASIGVYVICSSGLASWHDFRIVWLTWWIGDTLGAITLTPFLVLVFRTPRHSSTLSELIELFILLAGLILLCVLIFGPPSHLWPQWYSLAFLCLPFSVWAAFRFCPLESAGTNVVLSGFAIWGSLAGFGPFAGGLAAPLLLACFVCVACTMPLMIAARVSERRRVEEDLLGLHCVMQDIVDEKDALLQQTVDTLHDEVRDRGYAIRDSSGKLVRIAGRATDITKTKTLDLSLDSPDTQNHHVPPL